MSEELMTTEEAAAYLKRSVATLRAWRANGTGAPYYEPESRIIYYRKSDLDEWVLSGGNKQ